MTANQIQKMNTAPTLEAPDQDVQLRLLAEVRLTMDPTIETITITPMAGIPPAQAEASSAVHQTSKSKSTIDPVVSPTKEDQE